MRTHCLHSSAGMDLNDSLELLYRVVGLSHCVVKYRRLKCNGDVQDILSILLNAGFEL